jgi:hypothetical protein
MGVETYEVVVCGYVGPASRHALRPCSVESAETLTVLRADHREGDLVDLVRAIERAGLVIDEVSLLR